MFPSSNINSEVRVPAYTNQMNENHHHQFNQNTDCMNHYSQPFVTNNPFFPPVCNNTRVFANGLPVNYKGISGPTSQQLPVFKPSDHMSMFAQPPPNFPHNTISSSPAFPNFNSFTPYQNSLPVNNICDNFPNPFQVPNFVNPNQFVHHPPPPPPPPFFPHSRRNSVNDGAQKKMPQKRTFNNRKVENYKVSCLVTFLGSLMKIISHRLFRVALNLVRY